jgi:CrcB protein
MGTPHPEAVPDTAEPDPFASVPRRGRVREHAPVFAVVAAGGGLGASARYATLLLWPPLPAAFPWTTLVINVTGCAAMGIVMAVITQRRSAHRLLRPFVGTGVLGGYTTFSTYAADIQNLVNTGHAATGLASLALTVSAALAATWAAAALTHCVITRRPR